MLRSPSFCYIQYFIPAKPVDKHLHDREQHREDRQNNQANQFNYVYIVQTWDHTPKVQLVNQRRFNSLRKSRT